MFLIVIGLIAAVVMEMHMLGTMNQLPGIDPKTPSSAETGESHASTRFVNDGAGYSFTYPATWSVAELGARTRLSSPGGNIVLSFDVGPDEDLKTILYRLVRALGQSLTTELIGTSHERIAGAPALLRAGTTRSFTGQTVRFLAVAIGGKPNTYTISITAPAESDPSTILPTIETIVSSFRDIGRRRAA